MDLNLHQIDETQLHMFRTDDNGPWLEWLRLYSLFLFFPIGFTQWRSRQQLLHLGRVIDGFDVMRSASQNGFGGDGFIRSTFINLHIILTCGVCQFGRRLWGITRRAIFDLHRIIVFGRTFDLHCITMFLRWYRKIGNIPIRGTGIMGSCWWGWGQYWSWSHGPILRDRWLNDRKRCEMNSVLVRRVICGGSLYKSIRVNI